MRQRMYLQILGGSRRPLPELVPMVGLATSASTAIARAFLRVYLGKREAGRVGSEFTMKL